MDWQTSITFVFLAAAGGIVLRRLAAFARSGKTGNCGACSGCGDSGKDQVPVDLVQLAIGQDLSTSNRPVRTNSKKLHRGFFSDDSAGAEKNG